MSLILVCLCRAQARYAYSSDRWYGRRWSIWTGRSRSSGYFVGQISQDAAVSEHNKDEPAGQSNTAYMPKEAVIAKEGND